MTQGASNIFGSSFRWDVKVNQTITAVSQVGFEEIRVAAEESWLLQRVKQGNDFVSIFHPFPPDLRADVAVVDFPGAELLPLNSVNVFVAYIHAARFRLIVAAINA